MSVKLNDVGKKIAIAGAGPAGSSLAIRLAREGFDVTLIEREVFPRQKLCGEFISPECLEHFADLGVLDAIAAAGGDSVHETAFYSAAGRSVTVPSTYLGHGDALSLSRAEMDNRMMQTARSAGVRVIEDACAGEVLFTASGAVCGVRIRRSDAATETIGADVLVDATGRSAAIARLLAKTGARSTKPVAKPSFVGFKTHLRNTRIEPGRCEIYFFRGGYGGLTNIEGGLANLCFLVRSSVVRHLRSDAGEVVRRVVMSNKRASETLDGAEPAHDWTAVPLGNYGRKELNPALGVFCVGDAAAFIDPFTGSGMLLALESAQILSAAITAETENPARIAAAYSDAHKRMFSSRLLTASMLRRAAFIPLLADSVIRAASASNALTEMLARFTRRRAISAISRR